MALVSVSFSFFLPLVVKRLGVRPTWAAMLVILGVGLTAMLGSKS
jgi:hypothetical protein